MLGEDLDSMRTVTLDQVFISLKVTQKDLKVFRQSDHWMRPDQGEPLSALEAIRDCEEVVLLGDPGSGESSLVNHLLADIAECELSPETGPQPLIPAASGLLPVLIILRDLAPELARA